MQKMIGKGCPYVSHLVKEDATATKIDARLSCSVTQSCSSLSLHLNGNKLPVEK